MWHNRQKAKTCIAKHQLAWIIADCFNEKEIITLANQCGILHHREQIPTTPKDWLANDLAIYFFNEDATEKTVSQYLGQKAAQATRRIQYMNVEEIQTFLNSTAQLQDDGEFAEILWALLVDSREDVQQHGHKLLVEHEQVLTSTTNSVDFTAIEPGDSKDSESLKIGGDSVAPAPTSPTQAVGTTSDRSAGLDPVWVFHLCMELEQSKGEIDSLRGTVSTLKSEYAAVKNENDKLKQKIEQLAAENQIQKQTERLLNENKLRIHQLENENRGLRKNLEKLSDRLGEFHRLRLEKKELVTELESVEEAACRAQHTLEQMRSNFYSQFSYLQRIHEVSRTALTRARTKIRTRAGQQHPESRRRNVIGSGQSRVGVFVDVQNLFYAAKDRYAGRLDYIKLLDLIVGPRQLVIAYAYVVQIPEINQSGFLSLLEHNGYAIKSKDLRMRGDGSAKGDWDVGIAIDVVSLLDALDVVVLASGDGDFCVLAEMIKQQGKRFEVAAFAHNTSMDLQRTSDQFFPIGDDLLI